MTQESYRSYPDKVIVRVEPDLREIAPEFLSNARDDLRSLRAALNSRDFETLRLLGHSMKGVGDFGFEYLMEIGRGLERAAQTRNLPEAENLLHDMSSYLANVEVVFE
ncbi:MAG: Hpt domain-containing protein [Dehalococcoidia bacterium]